MIKSLNSKGLTYFAVYTVIILGAGYLLGNGDYTSKVSQTEKNRSKQDIKVVEKIIEKPGGERIIYRTRTEKKDETTKKKLVKTVKDKKWLVGLSRSVYGYSSPGPTHTLSVYKKSVYGLYVGVWGTTNSEYGVGLMYNF